MIGPRPGARQQQLDDQLLDLLGRGGDPPDGADQLVSGLAAWRGELGSQVAPATLDLTTVLPAAPVPDRGRSRWRRLVAGAGAALVVAGGGGAVAVAAAGAGPDSPLWPVTRLLHPERAEARLAQLAVEEVLTQARQAAAEGRYADAGRLLREAELLAAEVPAAADRQRLLAEVAQVRALLPVGDLPPAADLPPGGQLPPAGELPLPLPEPGTDPAVPEPPAGSVPTGDPDPVPVPDPVPDPTDPVPDPDPLPVPEPTPEPSLSVPPLPLPSTLP